MRSKKRFSIKFITAICFVLVLGFSQAVHAKKCFMAGNAYIGFAEPYGHFLVTYHPGPKNSSGGVDLHWISADYTFFGNFPTAVSSTSAVGVWKRTGNRTFDFTWLAYGLDASGAVVYILKPNGTVTFGLQCGTGEIAANMKIYAPDQDPLGDEPPAYGCVAYPARISQRLIEIPKITCE